MYLFHLSLSYEMLCFFMNQILGIMSQKLLKCSLWFNFDYLSPSPDRSMQILDDNQCCHSKCPYSSYTITPVFLKNRQNVTSGVMDRKDKKLGIFEGLFPGNDKKYLKSDLIFKIILCPFSTKNVEFRFSVPHPIHHQNRS